MQRTLVLAVAAFACLQAVSAYFNEEKGVYDDSTPYYKTLPKSDAYFIEDDIEIAPHRNAIPYSYKKWTNGVIPYVIDSSYPDVVKTRLTDSMREIEGNVNSPGTTDCIHFVARTTQSNYIYILPREHSCSSQIGMNGHGRQDVSIGSGCEHRGIIMHELMHAIGFWHEQSRPDRDNYVTIDLTNVGSTHRHNYNKHSTADTLHTSYDYGSVMHYNAYEFATDRSKPAMTPKNHQIPVGVRMGQRLEYSTTDVLKIQRLYQCKEDTTHVKQRIHTPEDHCNFVNGFCHLHQETSDDFNWSTRSAASTHNGPGADNSAGNSAYAVAYATGHSGKKARLTTRTYTANKLCVDWYFHNYGSTTSGYIKLLFVPTSGYTRTIKNYGHQRSKKWYHVYNTLTVNGNGSYKLAFEATVRDSDIAIDDINIYEGDCV